MQRIPYATRNTCANIATAVAVTAIAVAVFTAVTVTGHWYNNPARDHTLNRVAAAVESRWELDTDTVRWDAGARRWTFSTADHSRCEAVPGRSSLNAVICDGTEVPEAT